MKTLRSLEISALQDFLGSFQPRRAIEQRSLVPGRFIQVRKMKEQAEDGDLLAIAARWK
jgi:hypothetical protein